jgi:hypothetical protein
LEGELLSRWEAEAEWLKHKFHRNQPSPPPPQLHQISDEVLFSDLKSHAQNGARNDTNGTHVAVEGQCVVCTICVFLTQNDLMGTFGLLPPNRDFCLIFPLFALFWGFWLFAAFGI